MEDSLYQFSSLHELDSVCKCKFGLPISFGAVSTRGVAAAKVLDARS